jgi:hypothetical protein
MSKAAIASRDSETTGLRFLFNCSESFFDSASTCAAESLDLISSEVEPAIGSF